MLALSPLLVFVALYLGTSLLAGDFYKMPISVAFLAASVYAVAISGGMPFKQRVATFSHGASTENVIQMLWIFVLAGAFAHTARETGCIDATVSLALQILPEQMLMAGLFLGACFISLSIGTSVGTIVALTPIATGIAQSTETSLPLLVALVVGGSLFGDNLSFISDTTIAATSTQGCRQSDKFKVNSFIVVPSALLTLLLYTFMGHQLHAPQELGEVDYVKVLPYLVVLLTALIGINVLAVLTLGIVVCGVIGLATGSFDGYGWLQSMNTGILSMGELIIITMLASGLLEVVAAGGGIKWLIVRMTRHINGKRGAELCIATLVGCVNLCTANNTVAILTVGGIAKTIGECFGVDARKCASILDTMSCCVQGTIPYGAQILMAAGLASINPVSILPYLYYPLITGVATIMAILVRYPRRYS